MTAIALLAEVRDAGIRVSLNGDKLRLEAPRGAVSPSLQARLRAHKPELIAVLKDALGDTRARLLGLCADLPGNLVDLLADVDVDACGGLPDDTLRAYLRALYRRQRMDAGKVPEEWQAVARCDGCGPIWWHRTERLIACPWCFNRRAGAVVPKPGGVRHDH